MALTFVAGRRFWCLCNIFSNWMIILCNLQYSQEFPSVLLQLESELLLFCIKTSESWFWTLVLQADTRDASTASWGPWEGSSWLRWERWSSPFFCPCMQLLYLGSCNVEMHSQLCSTCHDGVEDIVSIPNPGDGEPVQTTIVFLPKESHIPGVMF